MLNYVPVAGLQLFERRRSLSPSRSGPGIVDPAVSNEDYSNTRQLLERALLVLFHQRDQQWLSAERYSRQVRNHIVGLAPSMPKLTPQISVLRFHHQPKQQLHPQPNCDEDDLYERGEEMFEIWGTVLAGNKTHTFAGRVEVRPARVLLLRVSA